MSQTSSLHIYFQRLTWFLILLGSNVWGQANIANIPPPPLESAQYQEWVSTHQEQFPVAFKALEKELKANSSNAQLHYQLGVVLMGLEDYAKAYANFKKHFESNSKDGLALFQMARCSQLFGQNDGAIELYQHSSNLRPTDPMPQLAIVEILMGKQDKAQAIRLSQQIAKKYPASIDAQTTFASLTGRDHPDEAINLYQAIIKNWPDAVEVQRALLSIYLSSKRLEEAQMLAQNAVRQFPQSHIAWEGLGLVQERQNKLSEAFNTYLTALQFAPKPTSLLGEFFGLGFTALQARDYAVAAQAYQQVLKVDPDSVAAMYRLGRVYAVNGKRKEAEELQKVLKKQDSDFAKLLAKDISDPLNIERTLASACAPSASREIEASPGLLKPKVVHQAKADYTDLARSQGIQGVVRVSVVFSADGRITGVRIAQGLPYGLNQETIKATHKIRFHPACRDNKPVSVRMMIEFTFNLK